MRATDGYMPAAAGFGSVDQSVRVEQNFTGITDPYVVAEVGAQAAAARLRMVRR